MKKEASVEKRKKGFQCYVCGEKEGDFRMCCGHPMIELIPSKNFLNWQFFAALERISS